MLYELGSLITRLLNIVLFRGGANMTTSARAYVEVSIGDADAWGPRLRAIDWLFRKFNDPEHCRRTWERRVDRAYQTIDQDSRIKELQARAR